MKILIVDDMKSNIGVITLLIKEWCENNNQSIDISSALNGQLALNMSKQDDYSIIFMDIMMPVMDGLDSLAQIRKSYLSSQPIIIMQTALGDQATKDKAKKLGANAYITKPVKYDMIEAMLQKYIDSNTIDQDEFLDCISKTTSILDLGNNANEHLSVDEFLEDYPDLDEMLDELSDIDMDINNIIKNINNSDVVNSINSLKNILNQYITILNTFVEFYELAVAMSSFIRKLEETDIHSLDSNKQKSIMKYLLSIIDDIQNWKEHIFVLKDAKNVLYINHLMPFSIN